MPKIIVCGKGGSGKSVLVTLLAQSARKKGYRVLVIDADESNPGLSRMLGLSSPQKSLLDYLGGKSEVQKKMIESFARREEEPKMELSFFSPGVDIKSLPDECLSKNDDISMVSIGKIAHAMEGCACPMGAVAREFLGKLSTGKKDLVLVDTEAGIEHFGRGLESSGEAVLGCVEASYDSILLAEKARDLAEEAGIKFFAVLTRVDQNTAPVIKNQLAQRRIVLAGAITVEPAIAKNCLSGKPLESGIAQKDAELILEYLEQKIWT